MPISVAFLGPVGTYGEKAARALLQLEHQDEARLVPCVGLRSVVEHVADGRCDAAVVPVENSVEGGVTASLDALWSNPDLCIRRALVLPIRHALLSSGRMDEISEVLSHPQALAQCSGWLARHLPNALQLATTSTAEAARMVQGSRFRAAIASRSLHRGELPWPIRLTMRQATARQSCSCSVVSGAPMVMSPVWRSRCTAMLQGRCWRPLQRWRIWGST